MKSNLLLDRLPQYTPSGLKIRTDFRESIKFELLMQDRNINEENKVKLALNLYYDKIQDVEVAVKDMLWFYSCNENKQNENKKTDNKKGKQIYSYEVDDKYIYSAFMERYKIDLNSIKYLHWGKFRALFNSLNENVQFSKIMSYRAINLNEIKDKDMKKRYRKLKTLYALPDMRSEEKKESDFADELW